MDNIQALRDAKAALDEGLIDEQDYKAKKAERCLYRCF